MTTSPNKPSPPCRFPVICIDDRDYPNEVPASRRPVKGCKYTVIGVYEMHSSGGVQGYDIEELPLDGCYPYKFHAAARFGIAAEDSELVAYSENLLKEAREELQEEVFQLNDEL